MSALLISSPKLPVSCRVVEQELCPAEGCGGFPVPCLDTVLLREPGLGSPSLEAGQRGSEGSSSQVL